MTKLVRAGWVVIKLKIMSAAMLILCMCISFAQLTEIQAAEKIKIGVYEYEPYFMIDEACNMSGYYCDFLKLLEEEEAFEYEIVVDTLNQGMKNLADGKIDIMLGVPMSSQYSEEYIFNHYSTNKEIFGIFSNKNLSFEEMISYKGLKLGLVEGDSNAEIILDVFQANDIEVSLILEKDYKTLLKKMEDNSIDLFIQNKWSQKDYYLVYEFVGRDVFIAGHEGSKEIIHRLDNIIEQMICKNKNPMNTLTEQYFGHQTHSFRKILTSITLIVLGILMCCTLILIRKQLIKYKIRLRIRANRYLLQYQPIYNPKTNEIIAFEGLIRQIAKNKELISPMRFIPEIEKNEMLYELSLWMIKKVIVDYRKIKSYVNMQNREFYLSINVSIKEIEQDAFVERAIQFLKESDLGCDKICLEIIERFKTDHIEKITENIKKLKQAGYKLAIDDFGVEYSNLDVFHKLNVDIIKVDKIFVDGIGKDELMDEVVLFISKLAHLRNQTVVLEGIEQKTQVIRVKTIENDNLFVQGFYYNKPMNIEHIEKLKGV